MSNRVELIREFVSCLVPEADRDGEPAEDAVEDVLAKALKFCDQFTVYPQAAQVFASSGKPERAEKLYKVHTVHYS